MKINSMVLWQYLNGNKVFMYFHKLDETDNRKNIESRVKIELKPPFNDTPSPKLLKQIWGVTV